MRQSYLFTRVFGVVILTIVMTALFTTFIYNYIATSIFTRIKENELLPRARALGAVLVEFEDQLDTDRAQDIINAVLEVNEDGEMLLGAYVVVTDEVGNVLMSSDGMREDYLAAMSEAALAVLSGGELRTSQIAALRRSSMVGVGVLMEKGNQAAGVVLMLVPLYEATIAMGSLNGALAMSLLLSLPFVAAMIYWVVGRLVWPLRQMRDVAVGLSLIHISEPTRH